MQLSGMGLYTCDGQLWLRNVSHLFQFKTCGCF
jgi:hypothetical protein